MESEVRIIAHRGNLFGPNQSLENSPLAIERALTAGFDVEVDVRWHNNRLMLGHDTPDYEVAESLLQDSRVWCHAKDSLALMQLLAIDAHCFGHDVDEFVLTSQGYIWVYPGAAVPARRGVLVLPERRGNQLIDRVLSHLGGVCTDFPDHYRQLCSAS